MKKKMIERYYFFTGSCITPTGTLRVHGRFAIKSWLPKPKDAYDEAIRLSKEHLESNYSIVPSSFHLKSLHKL